MDKEDVIHTHTHTHTHTHMLEYYSAIKKEQNFAISSNMDRHGGHYAKGNKSDRERQIPCDLT